MTKGRLWEIGEGTLRLAPQPVHLALPIIWSLA